MLQLNGTLSETSGIFNVGLVVFRNDANALSCLRKWQDQCLEACFLQPDEGHCGDQKYLDDWPLRFHGVVAAQHKGVGLAEWNISNYHLHMRAHQVMVDSDPLIFYHFHRFRMLNQWIYDWGVPHHHTKEIKRVLKRGIYGSYIHELKMAQRKVQAKNVVLGSNCGYTRYDLRTMLKMFLQHRLLIGFNQFVL